MKKLLINRYTLSILVFLIGIGIGSFFKPSNTINPPKDNRKEIVYLDSIVYVPSPYPVIIEKKVPIKEPYYVQIDRIDSSKVYRRYKDTLEIASDLTVGYDAYVTGTLDSLNLNIKDTRPEKIVYRTKVEQVYSSQKGIYLGAHVTPVSIIPSVAYQSEKNLFGLGYNLVTKTPQVSYHRRLF